MSRRNRHGKRRDRQSSGWIVTRDVDVAFEVKHGKTLRITRAEANCVVCGAYIELDVEGSSGNARLLQQLVVQRTGDAPLCAECACYGVKDPS